MTRHRQYLPNRRASETFLFDLNGQRFAATVSRFEDGRIGEIFLNNNKVGSLSDNLARDAAIIFSIAVQYGADADVIRRALSRDASGRALGPLGEALDLLDNVMREPKR